MITANELKRSLRIELDGDPYVVMAIQVQSPSARGASTLVKAKVRNLRTGNVFDRTFKASDKLTEAQVELRPVQYLYNDADGYHFMDTGSYEQFAISRDVLGDDALYLTEGLGGTRSMVFKGTVLTIDLPQSVVLKIVETDPPLKGATAHADTKPAKLETGLVIQVPSYLVVGESVQVDTAEGRFMGRAKT